MSTCIGARGDQLFGDRLRPFGPDAEILPGVRIVDATGHTPGHSAVLLASGGERCSASATFSHDRLQLSHPEWLPLPSDEQM